MEEPCFFYFITWETIVVEFEHGMKWEMMRFCIALKSDINIGLEVFKPAVIMWCIDKQLVFNLKYAKINIYWKLRFTWR